MQPVALSLSLSLPDAAATSRLGAALARASRPGDVYLLRGPLGAGKTTLVDAFARELGAGAATSPTFVIAHSYPHGRMPIWHVDLYRLEGPHDVDDLDLAQYFSPDAVTLVEWPERRAEAWPADRVEIDLQVSGESRTAQLTGFGKAAERLRTLDPHR